MGRFLREVWFPATIPRDGSAMGRFIRAVLLPLG
jgi:hypothetical protein